MPLGHPAIFWFGDRIVRNQVLALVLALAAAATPGAAAEPIRIGDLNSYASRPELTLPYRNGWQLALEQINASGGVLGRPLEVVSRDDGGTPGTAAAAAMALIAEGRVVALMGTALSQTALAASEAAGRAGVAFLAVQPVSEALARSKDNRHTFRLRAGTYVQANVLSEEAAKLPASRWATLAPDCETGRAAVETFKTLLKKRRPDAVFVAALWPQAGALDPESSVRDMLRADPEAIFNATNGADLLKFLRAGTPRGLFDTRQVVSLGTGEPESSAALKEELPEGWIVTGYPWQDLDTGAHQEFLSAYRLRFRQTPRLGSVLGYIGLKSLAAAIAVAGTTDSAALIAGLRGLRLNGPFGPIEYRAADRQSTLGTFVGRTTLKDGVAAMRDWRYVDGTDYLPVRAESGAN